MSYGGSDTDNPVRGNLEVLESEHAFLVIVDAQSEDWLVRFEKTDGFPASHWAHNMVRAYNERLKRGSAHARTRES